jgi:hypothetical protein
MCEMHCAGVRRDLQSAMCAMSKMQCVPSSRKTYPCQNVSKYVPENRSSPSVEQENVYSNIKN